MDRRRQHKTDWLDDLGLDAEMHAVALRISRALPLLSPSPEFAEDLGRELRHQARRRHQPRRPVHRNLPRPLLLVAAAVSLLGAAFYLWQTRWLHHPLVPIQRKP